MLKFLLQFVGWTLAHLPESVLNAACGALGGLMLRLSPRRRRLVYSNLHHAFPERDQAWRDKIARESSRRLFETALLSLAGPFFKKERITQMISVAPEVLECFRSHHQTPGPLIVAAPHMAYWESLTWLSLFLPTPLPEFGVIFRPLDNAAADAWVKHTREQFGMRLLSRKSGFQELFKILKRNGCVGVLFDQNAGMQGALTTLCGRVCSTTELPGILGEKMGAKVIVYYARRLGFWRMRFELVPITNKADAAATTLGLNRWLEGALGSDDALCASWLWSHDRWRNQDIPEKRFRLELKRNLLPEEMAARGWTSLPRKTRIWVRMPNWLGDVVMALPLLRALRVSRPDAELTLICKSGLAPLLQSTGCADRIVPLPSRDAGYFKFFRGLRSEYPDVYVLFTNSQRGDIEAKLTGVRQRFGIVRPGKKRSLLTHRYTVPADWNEAEHHQLELWERFFQSFGLTAQLDLSPLTLALSDTAQDAAASLLPAHPGGTVGLIAGSENTPEKRWPVAHWRALISEIRSARPDVRFVLFGTVNDRPITSAILAGHEDCVTDLAGRTDLTAYMSLLKRCSAVVCNDTGGMHLANALGVPVVGLFGPTNPVRTGPVFKAPRVILQPAGCPPTGGASLESLQPRQAAAALLKML